MTPPIARLWCASVLALALAAGCGSDADDRSASTAADRVSIAIDPGAEKIDAVHEAIAVIHGTEGNPDVRGTVRFQSAGEEGARVIADVDGLPPGEHAYHLHVYGDCSSADAKSAGTHFDLQGSSLDPPADIDRITGDLGVLVADDTGHAHAESTVKHVSMQGPFTILGRSVVVHEKGNDPTQPPLGGAGGRLGCGVVGVSETHA